MQRPIALKQRISGVISLFRPELPLAAAICVVIGELVGLGALPSPPLLLLGLICGFFLSSSALITNDYFDLEVDRINAPDRPLPAGLVSPPTVIVLGIVTALIGFAAAFAMSPTALGLSIVIWLMGFLYNWKFKAAGLWGNLIVCTSVASTFILGGIAVGQVWNRILWVFSLMIFFFDLAEEIAGDAMDAEGDKQRGSISIAILWGKQVALRISGILFGIVIGLSILLVAWSNWKLDYLLIILLMDVVIIYFVVELLRSQTSQKGRQSMRGLYLSGSVGLLAFLISLLLI